MAKRGSGSQYRKVETNLYLRGRIYYARYTDSAGKEHWASLRTSKLSEARKLRNQIVGKRDGLQDVRKRFGLGSVEDERAVPKVKEAAEKFITSLRAKGRPGTTTIAQYERVIASWIVPELGQRILSDVSSDDVEAFIAKVRRSPCKKGKNRSPGPTQTKTIFQLLKRIFRYALRKRLYVGANPCDLEREDVPKGNSPRSEVLSDKERDALLDELAKLEGHNRQLYYIASVQFFAGLSIGEACGLRWDDINLSPEAPTLSVRRLFDREENANDTGGALKNPFREATVPIGDHLASVLRLWKLEQGGGEWLFPSTLGTARKKFSEADRRKLKAAQRAAGITRNIVPHDYRATFGTALYEASCDPKITQRLLRHGSIQTTMRVYVRDRRQAELRDGVNAVRPGPRQALKSVD